MKNITSQEFNENYQDRLKRKEKIFDFEQTKKRSWKNYKNFSSKKFEK